MERAVFTQRIQTDQFDFLDNRFHGVLSKEASRQIVTVLDEGRIASASGTLMSNVDALADEAKKLCPFSRKVDFSLPTEGSSRLTAQNQGVEQISDEQIVDFCQAAVDAVGKRYPEMTVDVIARRTKAHVHYSNSNGVQHEGTEQTLTYSLVLQRSTEEDLFSEYKAFDHQVHGDKGFEEFDRFMDEMGRHIPIVDLKSDAYPTLLLAQTVEPFLTGFWQALDGKRLHEKQSPLAGQMGLRLFDPAFTLSIDSTAQGTGGFDVEGVAARPLPLVQAGVLQDAFYDLEYGQKCGERPSGLATGNIRERFRTEPIRIARGTRLAQDFVREAGRGIIVQHCGEVSRTTNLKGDFSCGLDALLFENGEVVGRIKNLNMSGNVFQSFSDGAFEPCLDGQDSPSLGVISPHLFFKSLRFAV